MGHNIIHTVYKDILLFKQKVHQIKLLFHGSRITVLTFTILGISIKMKKTIIESSYFLHQIKIHQIKLFFHGSRITVLSCTVLRLESKEIESSYFFTEAVQPVYFRLITDLLAKNQIKYFFPPSQAIFFTGAV